MDACDGTEMAAPDPLPPIDAAPLLPIVEAHLLELLRSLSPEDWQRPTLAPRWNVREVACHLLDTQLRKLSMVRDGHVVERPEIRSDADLLAFVNGLNEAGVAFYRKLSGPLLISLMEVASAQSAAFHAGLDPMAPAAFPVSWAGESASPNWFDTARELTERWHHQQQIREAVGQPGILTPQLYRPVLDCFLRGLPHRYRTVEAPAGSLAVFTIAGEAGGRWYLHRGPDAWRLVRGETGRRLSETTIPQEIAWRIFTKGISRAEALARVGVEGDREVGLQVLGLLAIIG
jgi:uncharacterized protein (TIGR03083 family)